MTTEIIEIAPNILKTAFPDKPPFRNIACIRDNGVLIYNSNFKGKMCKCRVQELTPRKDK